MQSRLRQQSTGIRKQVYQFDRRPACARRKFSSVRPVLENKTHTNRGMLDNMPVPVYPVLFLAVVSEKAVTGAWHKTSKTYRTACGCGVYCYSV